MTYNSRCDACAANIGFGTVDTIGCPLCGYGTDERVYSDPAILRIGRHQPSASHSSALRAIYGDDVNIVTTDVPYGDDPVAAVLGAIEWAEKDRDLDETPWWRVVAIELAAPEAVLMKLLNELSIPIIRPLFRKEDGRNKIVGKDDNGRDVFEVERYEQLAIEVRPTVVGITPIPPPPEEDEDDDD